MSNGSALAVLNKYNQEKADKLYNQRTDSALAALNKHTKSSGNVTLGGSGSALAAINRMNAERQARELAAFEPSSSGSNNGGLAGGVGYVFEKIGLGFLSSIEGMWDYAAGGLADIFGADDWAEQQFANDWVNYNHADEWFDPGKGWKVAGDVAGGIGTSLPAIGVAAGLSFVSGGTLAPWAISLASSSVAGLGAAGNATKEAYRETGELGGKEYGYGFLSGVTEAGVEYLTAGIGTGSGRIIKEIAEGGTKTAAKITAKEAGEAITKKALAKGFLKRMGGDFVSEAAEEALAEALSPIYKRTTYDPDAEFASLGDILYSGVVGGLSGAIMGGFSNVRSDAKSYAKGNKSISTGKVDEIFDISEQLMSRDVGASEKIDAIREKYNTLKTSLEGTGGQFIKAEQKIALSQLEAMNASYLVTRVAQSEAYKLIRDPELTAQRLSQMGLTTRDGQKITAQALTAGIDMSLSTSEKKSDLKKFARQVESALMKNETLARVTAMEVVGRLTLDNKLFSEMAQQGGQLISESDFRRFVESAPDEHKAALGEKFGIEDWDAVSFDTMREIMSAYAQNPAFAQDIMQQRRRRAAEAISAESAEATPSDISKIENGAHRYDINGEHLGIIREGDRYYLFNYQTRDISRALSESEVNKILNDLREISRNRSNTGLQKSPDSDRIDYRKSEEVDQNERQTIEDRILRRDIVHSERGDSEISGEGSRAYRDRDKVRVHGRAGTERVLSEDTEGRLIDEATLKELSETAIKDQDGRPISLYHATNLNFDKFEIGDIGFHFGNRSQAEARAEAKRVDNPIYINAYLNIRNPLQIDADYMNWHANSVALQLWNADIISDAEKNSVVSLWSKGRKYDSPAAVKLREILESKGYDGIAYSNDFEGEGTSYIAFHDDQIIRVEDSSADNSSPKVSNDTQSRLESVRADRIHEYLVENVKQYKEMSAANQVMIRSIVRRGRLLGISESDILMYAKVAARSGINITFDKESTYLGKRDSGEAVYADGFYHRGKNRIIVNPEGTRSADRLLIHELAHAIYKAKDGALIAAVGVENLSDAEKQRITESYAAIHKDASSGEFTLKIIDEQNAHYAEGMLSDRQILERLVEDKPTLKDKILEFFGKARTEYTGEPKLDAAAKKLYRQYKKLFDEFSAHNADTNDVDRTAVSSDEREYAIHVLENGNTFVQASRNVINSTELSEQRKEITQFFNDLLNNQSSIDIQTIEGDVLTITKAETADKARDNYKSVAGQAIPMDSVEFGVKLRAEAHIDELAETSNTKQKTPKGDSKNHLFAKDGFTYRTAYFEDFDGQYYKITLSIGHNGTTATVYNIGKIEKSVSPSAKVIAVVGSRALGKTLSNNSIPQNTKKSTQNSENVDGKDFALPADFDSDKVVISRGEDAKRRANYYSERVFSRGDVAAALGKIEGFNAIPKKLQSELINSVWRGYNDRRGPQGYELFTEVTYYRLHATLQQENGFSMNEEQLARTDEQIYAALNEIVASGKPSARSKIESDIRSEIDEELQKLRSSRDFWKEENQKSQEKHKLLGNLEAQAQKMRELKLGIFANATQYKSEIFKGSIEQLSRIKWRGNISVTSTRRIAANLLEWYSKDNPLLEYVGENNSGYFVEDMRAKLESIAKGEKTFTVAQLRDLRDIMSHLTNLVETYNKVFVNGKYADALPMAQEFVRVAEENAETPGGIVRTLVQRYMNSFGNPLTYIKFVDQYRENGFNTFMFNMLQRAGLDAQIAEMHALESYEEFLEKNKKYESRLNETVDLHGRKLSRAQLISLYMTSKREQAQAGLILNGYTYVDGQGKSQRAAPMTSEQNVNAEEIRQKISELQSEIEKLFSEADKEYIGIVEEGFSAAKQMKIDRDMLRYGYTNAIEGYYYPIRRANIAKSVDISMQSEIDRVSNASFNKDTVQGARQELYIEPVDSLFLRHVHAVAQYSYLSPAIDTFNRIFNLDVSGNKNKPVTVKTQTREAWNFKGKSNTSGQHLGENYFRKLIEDIQGISAYDDSGRLISKLRGKYATFALGANPKVWATQLSSMFASTSILDYSSLIQTFKMSATNVDKYCALAQLRNRDNTAALSQGVMQKLDKTADFFMKPIGAVDRWVIKRLFVACQAQIQKDGGAKMGTEENKIEAGKLLERVILETQQNSLATERSAAMRSSSEFMKSITMFTSDAMKVIGKVIDGFGETLTLNRRIKVLQKAQREGKTYLDEMGQASYSDNTLSNKKISAGMSDAERYEVLKDRFIENIPTVEKISQSSKIEISDWNDIDKLEGKEKRKTIKKIASEFDAFKGYENSDIDLKFDFSSNGYEESYSKQKKHYQSFAKLFSVFDDVIDSAVGIEVHNRNAEGYKSDPTLKNVYVLVSAFVDGENVVPVKLEVKEFGDKKNTLYVAITLDKIKKAEVSESGSSVEDVAQSSRPASTEVSTERTSVKEVAYSARSINISISRLFEKINPSDESFYKYIPEQFKNGAENTTRRTISEEIESLKKQKKAAGKRLGKALGALSTSALFMALVASGFRKLYHRDRDKTDEEKQKEFLLDFVGNFFGGLPIFKDIYARFADGYDIDNPTYSMINDVLNSAQSLMDAAAGTLSGEATSQERARAARSFIYSIGQMTGIPARNMYNILYSIIGMDERAAYKLDGVFYEKNYRNDLYNYIEDDNAKMIEFALGLVLDDSVGDGVSDSVKQELLSLLKNGHSVLPRSISSTITLEGQQYQLTDGQLEALRAEYADALSSLDRLFSKAKYKTLTAEDKERAIKKTYELYYDKAMGNALGAQNSAKTLIADAVGVENMALLSVLTRGVQSDTDRYGETIAGSKRAKVLSAINSLGLSREKKLLLICSKGYTIRDGDIRGLSADAAKRILLRYILSLKISKSEKARLAQECGFEVTKTGRIVMKTATSA